MCINIIQNLLSVTAEQIHISKYFGKNKSRHQKEGKFRDITIHKQNKKMKTGNKAISHIQCRRYDKIKLCKQI